MTNYEQINNLISSFSGKKNIISFPVVYLKVTKDLNTALLLNQLVFWSDKSKRTDGFFYKTYGEWQEEIYLSEYQIRRSIKKLKELNLVETKLKKANGSPTLHYRVLMNNLSDLILKNVKDGNLRNLRNEAEVSSESLTDDYTDNYNINILSSSLDEEDSRIPYKEIIDYLNEKTGKVFRFKSAANRKLIKARFNDGNTLDDFKKVIDVKTKQWLNDASMNQYLRPATLFGSKFDQYRSEYVERKPAKQPNEKKFWQELRDIYGDQ